MKTKFMYCLGVVAAFIGVICTIIGTTVLLSSSTHAISNAVANKAIAYGIYECYKDGNINNKVSLDEYDGLSSITNYGNNIILPTDYYDVSSVNCGQLIGGDPFSNFGGAAAIKGVNIPEDNSNTSAVSTFMKGMGYSETKADAGLCASYTYVYKSDPSSTSITKICATVNENRQIISDRVEVSGEELAFSVKVEDKAVTLDCTQLLGDGGCGTHTFVPGETSFDSFAGAILGDLEQHRSGAIMSPIPPFNYTWELVRNVDIESRGDVLAKFEFRDRSEAAQKAMQYLTGYGSLSATKLTESERTELLQGYLKNYYKVDNYGCNLDSSQQSIAQGAGYTSIKTNMFGGGYQTCWIKPTENIGFGVAGYNSQYYFDGTAMSYDDIIRELGGSVADMFEADKQKCKDSAESSRRSAQNLLNQSTTSQEYREKAKKTIEELDKILSDHGEYWYEENGTILCYSYTDLNGQVTTTPTNSSTSQSSSNNNSSTTADLDDCTGVAGSLGWILCPVLKIVSEGVDDIYDSYVQDQFLQIDPSQVREGSGIYESWVVIRNVANFIFVILFLIVLLSQLTGFGLSNYGIKKMLPRLIVIAVVVNVSFLICQFAVDVSNVLGYGLNALFDGMSSSAGLTGSLNQATSATSGGAATWVEILAVAIAASTIGSWLIPLLLTLLSCAISVFFGAVVLAARQAAIYILIVVAPAAIVCYALPNAKRAIFDRWLKIFTSMLMVFPICGALVGGGYFASNILLTASGGFFLTLVAMLLRVAPFLLIPSLVKSSMVALGNVGTKISNLGDKWGRNLSGSIARSDATRRGEANMSKLAGDFTKLRGRVLSGITGKDMSGRRKAKINRQYARYNKIRGEEAMAQPYALTRGSREYAALMSASHQKRIDDMAKNIVSENIGIATDNKALGSAHAAALAAVETDQSDESLATLQAFEDMLIANGDPGQEVLAQNMMAATKAGQDASTRNASQRLLRNHTKDIKSDNRDFFSYLGAASNGEVSASDINYDDKTGIYSSNKFISKGIPGFNPSSITNIHEGSLKRIKAEARAGRIDRDTRAKFDELTQAVFDSDIYHFQPKVADQIHEIRDILGLKSLRKVETPQDSGKINVQGNNAQDSGETLRTGNDNRQ